MVTTLAFRKNAYDGLTAKQKAVFKFVLSNLDLGEPALYKTQANVVWYIFDDPNISMRDLAAIGTFTANLGLVTNWNNPKNEDGTPDIAKTREQLRTFITNNWKLDSPPENEPNPYQWVLTNNGAPASVQAASGVPDTLTPVTT